MQTALKVTVVHEELDRANFAEARELSGLSQRGLSRKAGVHQNYVNRLESGELDFVPSNIMDRFVTEMAKTGAFKKQPKARALVWNVIRGKVQLAFQPSPVGPEGDGALNSAPSNPALGGHLIGDLLSRVAS